MRAIIRFAFLAVVVTAPGFAVDNDTPLATIRAYSAAQLVTELEGTNFLFFTDPARRNALAERIQALAPSASDEQLAKMQAALRAQWSNLNATGQGLTGVPLQQHRAAVAALDTANQRLGDGIRAKFQTLTLDAAKLVGPLTGVKLDNVDTAVRIAALAAKLDDSVLAEYMKTKMEGWSKSAPFCASVKQCTDVPQPANRKAYDLKGLFNKAPTHNEVSDPK